MSGVSDGQYANETTFNDAFMARNGDTDTIGKVGLLNNDVESGAHVTNPQGYINELADTDGVAGFQDPNRKVYANNNYIADGDDRKVAIGKLDAQAKLTQDQVDDHETRLTAAEGEIAVHETRLDAHDVTLADHEGRITQNETDIASHETRLDNHDTDIAGHETRLDQHDLDLADHEGRITDLESNNMTIGGDKTFSGNVIVQGDFEVQGTITSINSTNTEVEDQNILVNKNGTDGSAEGAGIDVERPSGNAGIRFDSTLASKFKIGLLSNLYEVIVSGVAQVIAGVKDFTSGIKTDSVDESTLNAGVTIDGVLIKDGLVDGRDVSADGTDLDNHIADTLNPHNTTAAQVGADPVGTAAAAVSAHESALDPHPQYLTQTEADGLYDALGDAAAVQSNLTAHESNTSNPHSVTKTQVGLGNVTDDAQLKRDAGDFNTFTEKLTLANDDLILIEDSADSFNKKKLKASNLPSGGGGGGTREHCFKLNGPFNTITLPANGVDTLYRFDKNSEIKDVIFIRETAGSGGSTSINIQVKPPAGVWTTIFTTQPVIQAAAGSEIGVKKGEVVPNTTAPVLSSDPYVVPAGTLMRMNLTSAETGTPNSLSAVVIFNEQ